jgi:hypothetical protein
MKTIQRTAHKWAAGAIALAVMVLAGQVMAQPIQVNAKVVRIKGLARYSTDNRGWQSLHVGDILKPGTTIQTAEKSSVDLQLGERGARTGGAPTSIVFSGGGGAGGEESAANVIRIFESSVLAIDKLTTEQTGSETVEETQLDLRAGQVMGNVKKLSAASKYEVKIPNGVAGIRGTVYVISSSGVVNVLAGSLVIAVVGPDGTVVTKVVTAGFSYDPMTGVLSPIPAALQREYWAIFVSLCPPLPSPPDVIEKDNTIIYLTPLDNTTRPPAPPPG